VIAEPVEEGDEVASLLAEVRERPDHNRLTLRADAETSARAFARSGAFQSPFASASTV
jgi:hypothetical protein